MGRVRGLKGKVLESVTAVLACATTGRLRDVKGRTNTGTSPRDGGNQRHFQEAATSKFSLPGPEQVIFVSKLPLK